MILRSRFSDQAKQSAEEPNDAENILYARVSQYPAAEVAKVVAKAIEKGKKEDALVGARALKIIGTLTNA